MTRRIQRSIDLGATLITAPERSGSGPGPERSSAGTECAHAGRSISWSASSMSARSGLHSACSALKTVRRARLDASGDISLSRLGFRGTADEGVLANPGAVDAGPVVHAGPRVELDCPARVIADIGSWPSRTSPGGLGAGATECGPGHDDNDEGSPAAVRHSPPEEQTTTMREGSPPRRKIGRASCRERV